MEKLLAFLNSLPKAERLELVTRCETSEGYLRKAISKRQKLGESLCINLDRESRGAVRCEDLRPDVDWAYLRSTQAPAPAQAPAAGEVDHG
ncbi:YdaS family helix-turn-helix protein [Comamonas testosteroni]|uniref:transcriptional regulator n=1 Tax=Comamonas testosteroni TaxID=285 RepID=UPI00265D694F|nr:YdaS family helix-turn-helix protein [Comamonas testosteroni]WKL15958.1 YdaS family helix-turn-helix protein [Comamonas testosteroni]